MKMIQRNPLRLAAGLMIFTAACSTVPITGRHQLTMGIPDSFMFNMSYSQYGNYLKNSKLSTNESNTRMVKEVGHRIQAAVERYMHENRLSSRLKGYAWEFNLVEDKTPNAFCMPGGKVVINTGILPYTADENGLAVVMGHEIAHAIADHGKERMAQTLAVTAGGLALNEALSKKPDDTRLMWMAAIGLGSQVGILLPYSRLHESEADKLGLIFMAMAGYDPRTAPDFWVRMSKSGGSKPPEFLSTHPSDQTRARKLQEAMPEAMAYYRPAN